MFMNMTLLQRSCEIQVSVDQAGRDIVPVATEIGEKTEELLKIQMQGAPAGTLEFNAMQRLVDRQDDSYRDI